MLISRLPYKKYIGKYYIFNYFNKNCNIFLGDGGVSHKRLHFSRCILAWKSQEALDLWVCINMLHWEIMPHFSGETSEINNNLTVLLDGCLCTSAFVFGAGFQADPVRALATVYYGPMWLSSYKNTQSTERDWKRRGGGGSQVHVFWLDVEISVPKSILRYMLNFTQELLAKGNIILFFSWSTRLCSILFQLGNVKSQNSNISANFRGNRVTLSVCLPESLPNSPHRPTSFSTPLSQ